jgi:small-conductance mechanosensitive channel
VTQAVLKEGKPNMYGLEQLIDVIALQSLQMRAEHWFLTQVLVWSTLVQVTAAAVGFTMAYFLARPLRRWLHGFVRRRRMTEKVLRMLGNIAIALALPFIALVVLSILAAVAAALDWPRLVLTTGVNLLAVWIVIRLTSVVIRHDAWARVIAVIAFAVATLNILDLLQPTLVFLDGIGVRLGNVHISLLDGLKGAVELTVLLWLAFTASRLLEQRIRRAEALTPSLQVLTSKSVKIVLVTAAFLIAMGSVGIDLTGFALFTGAVGIGVGFGLQKPISNLISGFILLLDRSIKPGDVIELGDPTGGVSQRFGWVTSLNARYVSLTTRDGTEWLIPNEDLITQRVINWTYHHDRLRLLTPFGVSFECDVRKAMELAVEAARETPRVLKDPEPVCRLMGFGDSSANLELRIWIDDPKNGIINVRSEVLLTMWEKYRANGIRTPLGHRDIFIKSGSELSVSAPRDPAGIIAA